jgi:hypothetical protein
MILFSVFLKSSFARWLARSNTGLVVLGEIQYNNALPRHVRPLFARYAFVRAGQKHDFQQLGKNSLANKKGDQNIDATLKTKREKEHEIILAGGSPERALPHCEAPAAIAAVLRRPRGA